MRDTNKQSVTVTRNWFCNETLSVGGRLAPGTRSSLLAVHTTKSKNAKIIPDVPILYYYSIHYFPFASLPHALLTLTTPTPFGMVHLASVVAEIIASWAA